MLVTIPAGATVECDPAKRRVGLVDVIWERQHYSVNLQDLLDACAAVFVILAVVGYIMIR